MNNVPYQIGGTNMIFITGDTHGGTPLWTGDRYNGYMRRFGRHFPQKSKLTRDDTVIICGDFGGVFALDRGENTKENYLWLKGIVSEEILTKKYQAEEKHLDWLQAQPFTTVFVDGNHENHFRLQSFPVVKWSGGLSHRIRDNVFHLQRGEIFTIEGHTFWAFGGASSHDMPDGAFDATQYENPAVEYKRWIKDGKMFRVKNLSWWEQELPSDEEMEHGRATLAAHNNKVDFILSHAAPGFLVRNMKYMETDYLNDYFDEIAGNIQFDRWFFGHYHDNRSFENDKYEMLYDHIIPL